MNPFCIFQGSSLSCVRYVGAGLMCQWPQEWQPLSTVEGLNLKEMSAAEFICKVGREWNFPRIEAERTGFHPGSVKVKP